MFTINFSVLFAFLYIEIALILIFYISCYLYSRPVILLFYIL